MSPLTKNLVLPVDVLSMLQHASSLDEISQYYVLPDKQDQLDFIVYDSPGDTPPWTQSYHSQIKVTHYRQWFQFIHEW